jgi:hypothetical protein
MTRNQPTIGGTVRRQPSAAEIDRVADAFDPDMLIHICETNDFQNWATRHDLPGQGPGRFYWYQDNGSDVLAVAHLDSVQADVLAQVVDTAAGPLVVSGALDDRLGAYVILELLPNLGVTCDWLLTTDEEIGRSTARDFADAYDGKRYNWLIEFDRGGTDVVMYDYETAEYVELVEAAGAKVGQGSYSDIADLEPLGCAAFNWGVGYQDYHGPRSHAWLADTFRMVARFLRFHDANHARHLPHDPVPVEDNWWEYYRDDEDGRLEADCGHFIDLYDDRTYREWSDGYILCNDCAGPRRSDQTMTGA